MSDAGNSADIEMPIPRSPFNPLGYALLWLLVIASVAAAVFNLSRPRVTPATALLASIAWLVLVAAMLVILQNAAGGMQQFFINCLGEFAPRHFVGIEWCGEEWPNVCFGYDLGRWRLYYVRIRLDAIANIEWRSGQATAIAGRDCNDWNVVILFDKRKSGITPRERTYPERLFVAGPGGPKETVEEFGMALVKFLRGAGARLVPTKDGTSFRRTRAVSPHVEDGGVGVERPEV